MRGAPGHRRLDVRYQAARRRRHRGLFMADDHNVVGRHSGCRDVPLGLVSRRACERMRAPRGGPGSFACESPGSEQSSRPALEQRSEAGTARTAFARGGDVGLDE